MLLGAWFQLGNVLVAVVLFHLLLYIFVNSPPGSRIGLAFLQLVVRPLLTKVKRCYGGSEIWYSAMLVFLSGVISLSTRYMVAELPVLQVVAFSAVLSSLEIGLRVNCQAVQRFTYKLLSKSGLSPTPSLRTEFLQKQARRNFAELWGIVYVFCLTVMYVLANANTTITIRDALLSTVIQLTFEVATDLVCLAHHVRHGWPVANALSNTLSVRTMFTFQLALAVCNLFSGYVFTGLAILDANTAPMRPL